MAHVNNYGSWWWEVISSNRYDLTLAISAVIFFILWYRWIFSISSDGAPPLPPGPLSLPIVGYLPFLGRELHKQFAHMAKNYGPIFKLQVGSKLYVVISTSELAKAVLRDQDHIFANRNPTIAATTITYGGQNLVWSNNNSYWRNLRKILVQEVLSNKNLQACSSLRKDAVRETIKNLYGSIGTTVNIGEIAFLTEANVITNMVWENTSVEAAKDRHLGAELQMVVSAIIELVGKQNISDIFPSLAWFDLQGVERGMKKQLKKLDQIFTMIIDDRIKSNAKMSKAAVEKDRKKDFLQILLELKDQNHATSLNITQIKALLVDIMTGGTETTTTLIEWAMTEIMQNRNVMKRIHEELVEIVGVNNVVEESHLPKLQYLDATVKETLRLHPIVPFLLPHSPSQTCTVGGYTIPKGCTIFLNLWSIHRDPHYWDDPLEFYPERFLTHLGKQNFDLRGNDSNYIPFGSGRRVCPGIPLAEKMQMYILASLLHSFNWNLPKGEEHDLSDSFGITLKKKKPLISIPSQRLPSKSLYM